MGLTKRDLYARLGTGYKTMRAINEAMKELGLGQRNKRFNKSLTLTEEDVSKIKQIVEKDLQPIYREAPVADVAWLAGFFEGEGYLDVRISKTNAQHSRRRLAYSACLELVNTEKACTDKASSILSVLGIAHLHKRSARDTVAGRPVWRVQITPVRAIAETCHALLPYLAGVRRRKAALMHEWALRHIALGSKQQGKFELAQTYEQKIAEVCYGR